MEKKKSLVHETAQEIQDAVLRKMTVEERIKLSGRLLKFAQKLSDLNDRKRHDKI